MERPARKEHPRRLAALAVAITLGIGGAGVVWFPRHVELGLQRNEAAAIEALKHLIGAQANHEAWHGRRGTLRELAELMRSRSHYEALPRAFDRASRSTCYAGYEFELYLGPAPQFTVIAWPTAYGWTGRRAFAVTELGDVHFTRNELRRYSGRQCAPRVESFLLPSGQKLVPGLWKTARVAPPSFGRARDGQDWYIIG